MSYEMLMGLWVSDDEVYTQYRQAMAPILVKFGGGFRYDFTIAEVLQNEGGKPINRVFTLGFKDRESRDAFFADPEYQKVKQAFFDQSVTARTQLAEYERP